MAAVTEPVYRFPPPDAPGRRRRRRLVRVALIAWILMVAGLAWWSVRHDPATVADQRDLGLALPQLQRASGVVVAAAGGAGRAVVVGELRLTQACQVTPVRAGVNAARDVTVYVPDSEAHGALDAVAAGLPADYRAVVSTGRAGTTFSLHADAGQFIGIDARARAGDQALTLRVSTGCRPLPAGRLERADPPAGDPPAALTSVLTALHAAPPGPATTGPATTGPATTGPATTGPATTGPATTGPATTGPATTGPATTGPATTGPATTGPATTGGAVAGGAVAVPCPGGETAATFVRGVPAVPGSLGQALRGVAAGGELIRDDPDGWVFRSGNDSVVVVPEPGRLRITATRGC
jgi:hypothetical protein